MKKLLLLFLIAIPLAVTAQTKTYDLSIEGTSKIFYLSHEGGVDTYPSGLVYPDPVANTGYIYLKYISPHPNKDGFGPEKDGKYHYSWFRLNDTPFADFEAAMTWLNDNLGKRIDGGASSGEAIDISYDNTTSGLTATNAQEAIDELKEDIDGVSAGSVTDGSITEAKLHPDVATKLNSAGEVSLENLIDTGDYYTNFNGTDSYVDLGENYTLTNDGDYLEITMRPTVSPLTAETQGVIGVNGTYQNSFGFFDTENLAIRQNSGSYIQVPMSDYVDFATYKLEVVNSGSEWEVFKNGESLGTYTKTDGIVLRHVGNTYNTEFSFVDVKDVKIHTSTQDFEIKNLYFSTLTSQGLSLKNETENIVPSNFAKCYVTYELSYDVGSNSSTQSGDERFIVYIQNEANKKYYYGFEIVHVDFDNDAQYTDLWRIAAAPLYIFNGSEMINTGLKAIREGDSEFVYLKEFDSYDYTGGFHGDEQVTEVNFFIDNVLVSDLATPFKLKKCSEFYYIQKSTMHQSPATNGDPDLSHTLEAIHHKKTRIFDSGYEVYNRIIWQQNMSIFNLFGGISSIYPDFAKKGYNENYDIATFSTTGAGTQELNDGVGTVYMWNESNTSSVEAYSVFENKEGDAYQYILDSATAAKFYRQTGEQTLTDGEEWNFYQRIKFLKQ